MPDDTDFAVEINQDGEVYFIEKTEHGRERFAVDSVQAMQNLEHAILDSTRLKRRLVSCQQNSSLLYCQSNKNCPTSEVGEYELFGK